MVTAMNSIKQMIDVNTIIGEPIKALDNTVIIPISKVGFGFAAGGSEFNGETVNSYNRREKEENIKYRLPFGGGSGAGVNITPVAFLIVQNDTVKLLEANHTSVLDKLVEYVPDAIDKINQLLNKKLGKQQNEQENYDEFDEEDNDDEFDWDDDDNDFLDEDNIDDEYNDFLLEEDDESKNENTKNTKKSEEKQQNKNANTDEIKIENKKVFSKNNKNNKTKKLEEKIKEIKLEEEEDE